MGKLACGGLSMHSPSVTWSKGLQVGMLQVVLAACAQHTCMACVSTSVSQVSCVHAKSEGTHKVFQQPWKR